MTIPQLFAAIAGTLCCTVCMGVFVRQKQRRFKALFWFAIGVAMVYAAFRPPIIEYLGMDSSELRLRLVIALLSFAVLTITLEAIRIGRMQERYAFLWLVTGSALFCGAMFPDLADIVSRLTGMSYGMGAVVVFFSFVLFMLFHVSVTLSRLQAQLAQVARELALCEERLRQSEKAAARSDLSREALE